MSRLPRRTLLPLLSILIAPPLAAQWVGFKEVFEYDSGLNALFEIDISHTQHMHVGGAAAGDVDGDGFADLVVARGNKSPRLFINQQNGTFEDQTPDSLKDLDGIINGLLLADINGDGHLDLLMGGVWLQEIEEAGTTPIRLFTNDGAGNFVESTSDSNVASNLGSHSMSMADIDGDGRVDLMVTYWQQDEESATGHLWRNLGDGGFEDISQSAGIGHWYSDEGSLFNFTPNFTDLDGDGWPDLVIAADFGNSRVFINQRDGTFADATDRGIITDENGMGATIGDFDNDGDFDWFVTSIWEDTTEARPYGTSGNRLYLNDGNGQFSDATESAGVREGDWGWGSCAADFDNDGWLDLLMVNGYQIHEPRFNGNPARLFMNDGDGTFTERAAELGIDNTRQGRAVVCFDSDNNGHIDVLIQNNLGMDEAAGQPQFYRNQGHDSHHWLRIELAGKAPNVHAIGARIAVHTGELTQIREIRAGNNYLSSEPPVAHFGLGDTDEVDRVEVRWPDGFVSVHDDIDSNQILTLEDERIFNDRFQ